ncbi:MAG: DUF120 domain-containing protein [Candidatus Moranbacteria bacterium]|nr:DUF120 domain-containing protein [Candidatus Moranbacteria bacterium]
MSKSNSRKFEIVITAGCFNHIHLGHVYYLTQAARYGHRLYVIVTNDHNNRKKNALAADQRIKNLLNLKITSQIITGHATEFKQLLAKINPSIICLGYDQVLPKQLNQWVEKNQVKIIKIPKLANYHKAANKFIARIVPGKNRSRYFLLKKTYQKKLKTLTKNKIYPGTLNLSVSCQNISKLLIKKPGRSIAEFTQNGKIFGGFDLRPVKLRLLNPGSTPQKLFPLESTQTINCWAIFPHQSSHQTNIIEIIHQQKITQQYRLKNHDLLELIT